MEYYELHQETENRSVNFVWGIRDLLVIIDAYIPQETIRSRRHPVLLFTR